MLWEQRPAEFGVVKKETSLKTRQLLAQTRGDITFLGRNVGVWSPSGSPAERSAGKMKRGPKGKGRVGPLRTGQGTRLVPAGGGSQAHNSAVDKGRGKKGGNGVRRQHKKVPRKKGKRTSRMGGTMARVKSIRHVA